MNMKNGFVLPTVLLFMQLFALLGLYCLQAARMEWKMNRDEWQYRQYEWKAFSLLHDLEDTFHDATCNAPLMSTAELVKKPDLWWELSSCGGNLAGNQYYYVVEFLGSDPCATILVEGNQKTTAAFYRVTLRFLPEKNRNIKILLQSTIALPNDDASLCADQSHVVVAGRQMWRRIG